MVSACCICRNLILSYASEYARFAFFYTHSLSASAFSIQLAKPLGFSFSSSLTTARTQLERPIKLGRVAHLAVFKLTRVPRPSSAWGGPPKRPDASARLERYLPALSAARSS